MLISISDVEWWHMQILLILFLACGLLNTLLSIPLILQIVKPNPLYGFRVRATLENAEVWYAVNRHFGQRFLWAGILLMISAPALYFIPGISEDFYAIACMVIFMIALIVALIQSVQYLRSLRQG